MTALQVAQAANAVRHAMGLPVEVFPFGQTVSMLSDELAQWRARGLSEAAFAATIREATGVMLPPGLLETREGGV